MPDLRRIELDQLLPHPPAVVWRGLTEPALLARWWAPNDIAPVVGHRFSFDMGPWGQQACEVLAVEPERLLRYRFAEGSLDTTITWTLEPEGTSTRLFLVHEGFDLDSAQGRQAFVGMGSGWPGILASIAGHLAAATA